MKLHHGKMDDMFYLTRMLLLLGAAWTPYVIITAYHMFMCVAIINVFISVQQDVWRLSKTYFEGIFIWFLYVICETIDVKKMLKI